MQRLQMNQIEKTSDLKLSPEALREHCINELRRSTNDCTRNRKLNPNEGKYILVAGPYIGELGWEIFDWEPLVSGAYLSSGAERCIVYADAGRERLYPFADEIRQLKDLPDHESECLGWHNFNDLKQEAVDAIQQMMTEVKEKDKPAKTDFVTIANLPELATPHYPHGRPDCLRLIGEVDEEVLIPPFIPESFKPKIVLCIRDRGMSDYRNMEYDDWMELIEQLSEKFTVIVTGQIQNPEQWYLPENVNVVDLVNQTTIDDMIYLFSKHCDLAVGGSTGTLHLASRCATPHLVWGGPDNVKRYAETNWFAADHKVYTWGWQPEVDRVAQAATTYLEQGVWL